MNNLRELAFFTGYVLNLDRGQGTQNVIRMVWTDQPVEIYRNYHVSLIPQCPSLKLRARKEGAGRVS